jgi:DNA modification methylase
MSGSAHTSEQTPCVVRHGDALKVLRAMPSECVHCIVTSPPYFRKRDYGYDGQLGLEATPQAYVRGLVRVLREARRVLRGDGTLWLNLGDTYSGGSRGKAGDRSTLQGGKATQEQTRSGRLIRSPRRDGALMPRCDLRVQGLERKNLIGIPWLVAFALQRDGWILRQDIVWHKPNPMPGSVTDRCTTAHEYIFLLSRRPRYWFDARAISEPAKYPSGPGNVRPVEEPPGERRGANANVRGSLHKIGPRDRRLKRSVWSVPTVPSKEKHFAQFPPKLVAPCILAGCPRGGVVLDPFCGTGTTLAVAIEHGRRAVGIDLSAEYVRIASRRAGAALAMTPLFWTGQAGGAV